MQSMQGTISFATSPHASRYLLHLIGEMIKHAFHLDTRARERLNDYWKNLRPLQSYSRTQISLAIILLIAVARFGSPISLRSAVSHTDLEGENRGFFTSEALSGETGSADLARVLV